MLKELGIMILPERSEDAIDAVWQVPRRRQKNIQALEGSGCLWIRQRQRTIGLAMVVVIDRYSVSYTSRAVDQWIPSYGSDPKSRWRLWRSCFTDNLFWRKRWRLRQRIGVLSSCPGLFGTTFFHSFTILSVTSLGATVSSCSLGLRLFSLIMEIVFSRKKTRLGFWESWSPLGIYPDGGKIGDLMSTNFKDNPMPSLSTVSWVVYCFWQTGYHPVTRRRYAELPGACQGTVLLPLIAVLFYQIEPSVL